MIPRRHWRRRPLKTWMPSPMVQGSQVPKPTYHRACEAYSAAMTVPFSFSARIFVVSGSLTMATELTLMYRQLVQRGVLSYLWNPYVSW